MRAALAGLVLAAALLQAFFDWRATIGEGYAYRLTSIGAALQAAFPAQYARLTEAAGGGAVWVPVGAALMALPLALALLVLAALIWVTRRRRRSPF